MFGTDVGKQFGEELTGEEAHVCGGVSPPDADSLFAPLSEAHAVRVSAPEAVAQADWTQFNPWHVADGGAQEPRRVNTITIFRLAKKIMAQEWSRARGVQRRDPRAGALEREVVEYRAREIELTEIKRRQAIRMSKERGALQEGIKSFVDQMLDERRRGGIATLDDVAELLAAALICVGKVIDVEWTGDGACDIWLEPWPELRKRLGRGAARPALRRIRLDGGLNISAYERITDDAVREEKRRTLMLKPLRLTARDISKLRTPDDTRKLLVERASQAGRVTRIAAADRVWKIRVQPWEEVRRHRLRKSSAPGTTEYEITVNQEFHALSCERVAE